MKIAWVFIFFITLSMAMSVLPSESGSVQLKDGDFFHYDEIQSVFNGKGSCSGLSCNIWINGTESVTSVAPNHMVGMNYNYSCSIISTAGRVFNPNEGSGKFTFSSLTCKYVNGTDNETGYNSPSVWFYINASSSNGKTISLLDTNMTVISSNYSYKTGKGQSPLATIYVKGTGSCQRVFSHQTFSATYSWQAYFDKSTGFIVSYGYFQNDTNSNGNSFSCSNKLIVSSSSYGVHLVPQTAPTPKTTFPFTDVIFSIIAIFIVAILIVLLVSRHGRNNKLSKHSNTRPGVTSNMNNDNTADGKPLDFKPESGGTEQIVIKEIVKVKCEYCGALIDSTAKKCPFCGAPRN